MNDKSISISISGMSCNHCVASAEKALRAVSGVESVAVSLEPGAAIITGTADRDKLIAAIIATGYEAE